MIERLIDQEKDYGEPVYSQMEREIENLKERLKPHLEPEWLPILDQISEKHLHQTNAVLEAAWKDGFCTAMKLVAELLRSS